MASEPKKIEDWLKGYAEKRKAASADFELHPATRNLLQGEVARTFGKTDGREKKKSLLLMLWPRLAIAGAFTAMFILTVMVLNKPQREMEFAQSSTDPIATAPVESRVAKKASPAFKDGDDMATSPKSEIAAPPAASANQFAEREDATRRALAKETKLSEPIQQPVPAERKSDTLADKKLPAKSETAEAFARTKSVSGAITAGAPQSPANEEPKLFYADAETQTRWQFVQQDSRGKYRQNLLSPEQPRILQSFELVRTGNQIRLTESDGSIYEGEILAAAQDKTASREQNSGFAFRAVGTNQQLNRIVTFTGNFVFTNRATFQLGALAKQKADPAVGIVEGKVSIAGTNRFNIRAAESVE